MYPWLNISWCHCVLKTARNTEGKKEQLNYSQDQKETRSEHFDWMLIATAITPQLHTARVVCSELKMLSALVKLLERALHSVE